MRSGQRRAGCAGRVHGQRRDPAAARPGGRDGHDGWELGGGESPGVFPARALYLSDVRNVLAADIDDDELVSVWMRPEFIDAVARRIVQLGVGADSDKQQSDGELLTVSEVARRLNASPHWVYAHKRDLGAIRLGDGPKARLRFHLAAVLAELNRRSESRRSDGTGGGEARKRTRRRLVSRPLPRASRTA